MTIISIFKPQKSCQAPKICKSTYLLAVHGVTNGFFATPLVQEERFWGKSRTWPYWPKSTKSSYLGTQHVRLTTTLRRHVLRAPLRVPYSPASQRFTAHFNHKNWRYPSSDPRPINLAPSDPLRAGPHPHVHLPRSSLPACS